VSQLSKTLLCVVAGAALTATSIAQAKTVWNFNMWGGKRAFTAGVETINKMAKADTNGEFEINIQYGDALGPRKQNPENIKNGAMEAGQLCVGYYPNKYPLTAAMELPFLLPRDLQARANVELEVLAHPEIVKELAGRWNSRFFGPAFLPAYEFMGNKKIVTTADMKGVKMRISGLNAKALEAFGAVPTMVTAPDGYEALRRGTIDSFGFPYSYAFGAYKLYEVSKYVTEGLGLSGFMCLQVVSIDAWNAAPKIVRDNMPNYQQEAIRVMIAAYEEADKKWRPIFRDKLDMTVVDPSVRAELAAGSAKIWNEWAAEQDAKGRKGTEVLNFIKASVAKHSK
jgi:TRAP-type C4-dicarboxylate transport system substrate-binding protein